MDLTGLKTWQVYRTGNLITSFTKANVAFTLPADAIITAGSVRLFLQSRKDLVIKNHMLLIARKLFTLIQLIVKDIFLTSLYFFCGDIYLL